MCFNGWGGKSVAGVLKADRRRDKMRSAAWSLLTAYAFELGLGGALLLWPIFAVTATAYSAFQNRNSEIDCSWEAL